MPSLSGPELLNRFEIIGEDGEHLPLEHVPNRQALVEREPRDGVLGYRVLPGGDALSSIVRSTPILDEARELRLVINVFHDITQERNAQERLRFPPRRARCCRRHSSSRRRSPTWSTWWCRASPTTASLTARVGLHAAPGRDLPRRTFELPLA